MKTFTCQIPSCFMSRMLTRTYLGKNDDKNKDIDLAQLYTDENGPKLQFPRHWPTTQKGTNSKSFYQKSSRNIKKPLARKPLNDFLSHINGTTP